LSRPFSGILRNRSALFSKSSATEPAFFRNSQELIRSFFEILSNLIDHFLELPACDRKFSKKSVGGSSDLPGFGNGLRRWGLRPHTPMSEQCSRPRRGAPAADQSPEERTGNLFGECQKKRPSDSKEGKTH
jgi:hypothetical protein